MLQRRHTFILPSNQPPSPSNQSPPPTTYFQQQPSHQVPITSQPLQQVTQFCVPPENLRRSSGFSEETFSSQGTNLGRIVTSQLKSALPPHVVAESSRSTPADEDFNHKRATQQSPKFNPKPTSKSFILSLFRLTAFMIKSYLFKVHHNFKYFLC